MAHLLTPAPATATTPIAAIPQKTSKLPSLRFQRVGSPLQKPNSNEQLDLKLVARRTLSLGLASAVLGLNAGDRTANAAARRPPPPPQGEKKDPSVNGVLAKVLASKKRKEAMKQNVEKLREKGKIINE